MATRADRARPSADEAWFHCPAAVARPAAAGQSRPRQGGLTMAQAEALASLVLERCEVLGRLSEEPQRLTRTALTEAARRAQDLVAGWMAQAGLEVRRDAATNVIGRLDQRHRATGNAGEERGSAPFLIGSHLDTVPGAGSYDGVLGVLLGIALAQAIGDLLAYPLEVVAFADEEGVRFGTPFLGSRALAGSLDASLLSRRDAAGTSLEQALRAFGCDPAALPSARVAQARGFFEIHIEQGPVLEARGVPLGVVTGIAGQTRLTLTFQGRGGHAGATPMRQRSDALAGAAALITAAERYARATPGLLATVGRVLVEPGAANVIPHEAQLCLDVRHPDDAVRRAAVHWLLARAAESAGARGLHLCAAIDHEQPAVACDATLTAHLAEALTGLGYPLYRLVSGAGHDAMVLASQMPVAMLFVRSPGGVSHHPKETVHPADVAAALRVAAQFLIAEGARGPL